MQFSDRRGRAWLGSTQVTTAQTERGRPRRRTTRQQYGDYIGLSSAADATLRAGPIGAAAGRSRFGARRSRFQAFGFVFGKSTFSEDEVSPNQSFSPAYFLNVDGFTNESLGFNVARRPQRPTGQPAGDHGERRPGSEQLDPGADRDDRRQPADGQQFRSAADPS